MTTLVRPVEIKIPIYQPYLKGNESQYINDCLASSWISSKGSYIEQFEKKFTNFIGSGYSTSVFNGTVALHLALSALGIQTGDEVIVPTLTYVASVNTIVQTGATPVFADSLLSSWQLDPQAVEALITPNTKAIMAVHLYGHSCEMESIVALCKKYDLLLIEDCAEALGSYYKGQHVGTFGDAATFSFFGNKTITTGEGGMVVFKNQKLHELAANLKNQGIDQSKQYWHDKIAFNYRMTNIQAAIGLAQLEQVETILAKKKNIAFLYQQLLKDLPLKTHVPIGDVQHSYWMCSILLENEHLRDPLRAHLAEAGIETRPLFYPVHTMPMYQAYDCKKSENASYLSARGINLPSYPGLEVEHIQFICECIRLFFK